MTRARAVVAIAAASSSVAACFFSLGDVRDAPASDAGATIGEAEAASDGASPDAGACTGAHLFCDDFDDGLDPKWAKSANGIAVEPHADGGSMVVATLPPGGEATTFISFATGSTRPLRIAFQLRLTDPSWEAGAPDNANFAFVRLTFADAAGTITAAPYVGPQGGGTVQLGAQLPGFKAGSESPMAFDRWQRIVLTADFGASTGARLEADGQLLSEVSLAGAPEGAPLLQIGLTRSNSPTPALRVEIDDVVVDEL